MPNCNAAGQQLLVVKDLARRPGLDAEEQHDDGNEGNRGDDEIDAQGHEHAAIVEKRQRGDHEQHERRRIQVRVPQLAGDGREKVAGDEGVAGFKHGVGHHQVQGDVEGHQGPDDVLGLGILAAGRRHRGGHLGVDHGHAGVEQADYPACNQRCESAALADGEVPPHELAHQHDPDPQGPDVSGSEDFQQVNAFAALCCGGCGVVAHFFPPF